MECHNFAETPEARDGHSRHAPGTVRGRLYVTGCVLAICDAGTAVSALLGTLSERLGNGSVVDARELAIRERLKRQIGAGGHTLGTLSERLAATLVSWKRLA